VKINYFMHLFFWQVLVKGTYADNQRKAEARLALKKTKKRKISGEKGLFCHYLI